jgi:type III pantothenate kinase
MLLAIDAGNTRIKWGLFDAEGKLQSHGACLHAALNKCIFPQAAKVIISNVAGKKIKALLTEQLAKNINIQWLTVTSQAGQVINGYDQPETLGTDRWAAMIGAWHLHQQSCIVVNAGTTVTIDALIAEDKSVRFIGGMILPGINLMYKSLNLNTAQLADVSEVTNASSVKALSTQLGTNTQAVIKSGVMNSIVGAISQMIEIFSEQTRQLPLMILSGGDANMITQRLATNLKNKHKTHAIIVIDHLVLLGLLNLSQHQ